MNEFRTTLVRAEIKVSQPKQGPAKEVLRIALRAESDGQWRGQVDFDRSSASNVAEELESLAKWVRANA